MKRVVRIICMTLAVVMATGALLCGCDNQKDTASDYPYANYDLAQFVKIGQYKGVEVAPYPYELTEAVVQQQISIAISNYAKQEEKQGAIANGDQVNIDFTGYIDGEQFEGGSAASYSLAIGSGSFIPGFEAGLVGAKAGDTVTLDIAFPDPYTVNPDLAGKPVRFEVKINKVYAQVLPEYTDAFVQKYYGYGTVAEFETALRASIQEQYDSNKRYFMMTEVWKKVLDGTEFLGYPEAEYKALYDEYLAPYTKAAQNASMTLSQFLELSDGITESELSAQLDEQVKAVLQEDLLFWHIVSLENITLTNAEYKEKAEKLAADREFDTVEDMLESYDITEQALRESMLFDKMMGILVDSCVIKNTAQ